MGFRIRSSWPLVIVLALTAAGAVATVLPDSSQKASPLDQGDSVWRRTKDGWEIAWWLHPTKTFHKPGLHPLVLAVCQLMMVSLLGLLYRDNSQHHRRPFRGEEEAVASDGFGRVHTIVQPSRRFFVIRPHAFHRNGLSKKDHASEKS